jgi:hypothetical protein
LADQVQLEQVIGNLVKNGIEAMGESTGERVLTIRTRPLDDGTVGVCVIDRGGGLADVVRADPLRPLSPPSPMASVSASPSAAPSSRTMAGECGSNPAHRRVPPSASAFRSLRCERIP